jgi:hypothetical protein
MISEEELDEYSRERASFLETQLIVKRLALKENRVKTSMKHALTIAQSKTSTSTITDTTTLTPLAASTTLFESPTITLTTTSTSTSTIISTLTTTTTSFAPQATYYAACAPNNLVGKINGNRIGSVTYHPGLPLSEMSGITTDNAYDCCAQCAAQSACAGAEWIVQYQDCTLYLPSGGGTAQLGTASSSNIVVVTSNGYRSYWTYP